MKRLLAVLGLSCAPAFAQVWISVGISEEGAMQIDVSSIRPQGQYMKAWSRFVYNEPKKSKTYPPFIYSTVQSMTYYDCKAELMADKQYVYYDGKDGDGKMVQNYAFADGQLNFQDPIPGTLGQSLLRRVCFYKR